MGLPATQGGKRAMLSRQDNELLCRVGPGMPVGILDRTDEHLGSSDTMVIRTRRRVIHAARALRDDGVVPPGVDEPEVYRCRSGGVVLPRDADWLGATKDLRRAFARS
jgi:hypothetical protein